jgi:hypothetical protein
MQLKNEECPVPPSVGTQSTFTFTFGIDPDWIDATNLPILTNLKYRWTFNSTVAKAQTPTDLPTLTLLWLTQPTEDVTIKLDISADKSINVLGSINVHIHSQLEGELAQKVCRLRQIIKAGWGREYVKPLAVRSDCMQQNPGVHFVPCRTTDRTSLGDDLVWSSCRIEHGERFRAYTIDN